METNIYQMQREGKIKLPSIEFMNNLADHIQDPAERLIELIVRVEEEKNRFIIRVKDRVHEAIFVFLKDRDVANFRRIIPGLGIGPAHTSAIKKSHL